MIWSYMVCEFRLSLKGLIDSTLRFRKLRLRFWDSLKRRRVIMLLKLNLHERMQRRRIWQRCFKTKKSSKLHRRLKSKRLKVQLMILKNRLKWNKNRVKCWMWNESNLIQSKKKNKRQSNLWLYERSQKIRRLILKQKLKICICTQRMKIQTKNLYLQQSLQKQPKLQRKELCSQMKK